MRRRLQIGCGARAWPGFVNVDRILLPGVDVVADLDRRLPFREDAFDEVHAVHVLEHVADLIATLGEIARVSRPGSRLFVAVPHFSCVSAYQDPTHKRFFGYFSFDYFTETGLFNFYSRTRLRIVRRRIHFYWIKNDSREVPSSLMTALVNLWPLLYERFLCWMLPSNEVRFEFEIVKKR